MMNLWGEGRGVEGGVVERAVHLDRCVILSAILHGKGSQDRKHMGVIHGQEKSEVLGASSMLCIVWGRLFYSGLVRTGPLIVGR